MNFFLFCIILFNEVIAKKENNKKKVQHCTSIQDIEVSFILIFCCWSFGLVFPPQVLWIFVCFSIFTVKNGVGL